MGLFGSGLQGLSRIAGPGFEIFSARPRKVSTLLPSLRPPPQTPHLNASNGQKLLPTLNLDKHAPEAARSQLPTRHVWPSGQVDGSWCQEFGT